MSAPDQTEVSEARGGVESEVNGDRWRRILTLVLVVLTSVSLVSAAVAVWAHQVVFNTDRFMETVAPVLNDDDVYVLLGDRATDSVLQVLAIEDRLEDLLGSLDTYISDALSDALPPDNRLEDLLERIDPPTFAQLAAPIAGAIETRIDNGVHVFFNAENFSEPLTALTRRAHEVAVALVRADPADYPNVYIEDGEVKLDLTAYIGQALSNVTDDVRAALPDFDPPDIVTDQVEDARNRLADALDTNLPEDFGQVTIMSADVLSQAQDAAAQLDRYAWIGAIVSVVLLIATLLVSPHRRRTVLQLGIGVFVAVIVVAVTIRWLQSSIIEEIVDPQGSVVADNLIGDVLSGFRTLELLIAVGAIAVAIVAYLAGRPDLFRREEGAISEWTEPATGGSKLDRWIAARTGALQVTGVVVAAVVLFFAGLDLVSIIVIGVLLAAYLWYVATAPRRVESAGAEPVEDKVTARTD
jgi:hypothetical protein